MSKKLLQRKCEKFSGSLENFGQSFCSHAMFIMGQLVGAFDTVWKLSRVSKNFQTVRKLFILLETFQALWKL